MKKFLTLLLLLEFPLLLMAQQYPHVEIYNEVDIDYGAVINMDPETSSFTIWAHTGRLGLNWLLVTYVKDATHSYTVHAHCDDSFDDLIKFVWYPGNDRSYIETSAIDLDQVTWGFDMLIKGRFVSDSLIVEPTYLIRDGIDDFKTLNNLVNSAVCIGFAEGLDGYYRMQDYYEELLFDCASAYYHEVEHADSLEAERVSLLAVNDSLWQQIDSLSAEITQLQEQVAEHQVEIRDLTEQLEYLRSLSDTTTGTRLNALLKEHTSGMYDIYGNPIDVPPAYGAYILDGRLMVVR